MKSAGQTMESITVRRASLADADKVRYRVYSTPTEFIAVIAESALMAVKVAGIKKPHKIVRDIPTQGAAVEAQRVTRPQGKDERVALPVEKPDTMKKLVAELAPAVAKQSGFTALRLSDLQQKGKVQSRILPADLLNSIIEEHVRAINPALVADAVAETMQSMAAPVEAAPPLPTPMPAPPPEPQMTQEERITRMAEEVLPKAEPAQETVLSPEEVQKLLNG